MQIAFRNKKTQKTFKVIGFDNEAKTVTMQGELNTQPFVEPYDKARFEALGYELVKLDADGKVAQ